MAAQWRLLTEYLNHAGDDVQFCLERVEQHRRRHPRFGHRPLPAVVARRPAQHPGVAAAGYEATAIRPGISVRFTRTGRVTSATVIEVPHRPDVRRLRTAWRRWKPSTASTQPAA